MTLEHHLEPDLPSFHDLRETLEDLSLLLETCTPDPKVPESYERFRETLSLLFHQEQIDPAHAEKLTNDLLLGLDQIEAHHQTDLHWLRLLLIQVQEQLIDELRKVEKKSPLNPELTREDLYEIQNCIRDGGLRSYLQAQLRGGQIRPSAILSQLETYCREHGHSFEEVLNESIQAMTAVIAGYYRAQEIDSIMRQTHGRASNA